MSGDEPTGDEWTSPGAPPPASDSGAPPPAGWSPPTGYAGQGASGPPPPAGWPASPYGWSAPRPGVIPLRPLGVGELLDGAFSLIRRYPAATLGLAAVVSLVVEAVRVVASYYLLHGVSDQATIQPNGTVTSNSGDVLARSFTLEGIVFLIGLVAAALLTGLIATVLGQGALGRPMSAGEAWTSTRPVLPRLARATLLINGLLIGIPLVCLAPAIVVAVAGSSTGAIALFVIGGVAGGILDIWVYISLSFTTPALMLEKQGVGAAIARSRHLVKGSWWRIFWIWVLAAIIAGVVSAIIAVPFTLIAGAGNIFSSNSDQFRFTPLLISGIGGLLGSVIVAPFRAGVTGLLYLDRRMRTEALDLALQQASQRSP